LDEIEPYIKVYEWLVRHPELTRLDALLISKIMQFPCGCWISSFNLGGVTGAHWRTIQKKLKALQKKGWVAILPDEGSNKRIVWATLKKPPLGQLFDYNEKSEKGRERQIARNIQYETRKLAKQLTLW
jgi:hypothetical protein